MIKKFEILGVGLENYTAQEAAVCIEHYLSESGLNTIESISIPMLLHSQNDPMLCEVLRFLDLAVIGEKEILQAANIGTTEQIKETEENAFSSAFFNYMESNKKSIFLLAETTEKIGQLKKQLEKEFPKLIIAGEYAVETCVGNLETVINEMNVTLPDVIVSILSPPMQEQFLHDHKEKMNAGIWYGMGGIFLHKKRCGAIGWILSRLRCFKLKNSISKFQEKEKEA